MNQCKICISNTASLVGNASWHDKKLLKVLAARHLLHRAISEDDISTKVLLANFKTLEDAFHSAGYVMGPKDWPEQAAVVLDELATFAGVSESTN